MHIALFDFKTLGRFLAILHLLILPSFAIEFSLLEKDLTPKIQFAQKQLQAVGETSLKKVTFTQDAQLQKQSFRINGGDGVFTITGGDEIGLMYGGLDLAERIRLKLPTDKLDISQSPHIKRRGLKMNISLDARCPSYDDSGTSARASIKEVWSEEFWHAFLDRMAEHRYNTLTLWSNHPFTALMQLEKYPDAALPDVAEPTYKMDDKMLPQYRGKKLQDPQHYRIIKKMTMAEKTAFWQGIMRYAKDRGIDIYFITWNIWLHGAEGKYGITTAQTNEKTIAYLRESVKQFVLTFPDLKGIGITCGEHMQNKLEGEYSVENWMWKTYGLGIVDAKKVDPTRKVHFIHRLWYSSMDVMWDDFISKYPDQIDLGFKYARARLYSVPNPPFFKNELLPKLGKYKLGCWMNLRNDDLFNFRWGNPDYVRDYICNLPPEPTLAGIHMGSDGYVWAREFTSKQPQTPRQLEIDKHWYRFMLWGRLAYNPKLERSFFEAQLAARFPKTGSPALYTVWQTASKIVPLINTWHWRSWDHMWSVETCMSKKEGYHGVNHFIQFSPLKGQGMQGIQNFVKSPNPKLKGPEDIAQELDALASTTLKSITPLQKNASPELQQTLGDLTAFAHLASYYADKTRGSEALHRFRTEGLETQKTASIDHLTKALAHWDAYAKAASSLYETQLLARTSDTDWTGRLRDLAAADIQIAQDSKKGIFPPNVLKKK